MLFCNSVPEIFFHSVFLSLFSNFLNFRVSEKCSKKLMTLVMCMLHVNISNILRSIVYCPPSTHIYHYHTLCLLFLDLYRIILLTNAIVTIIVNSSIFCFLNLPLIIIIKIIKGNTYMVLKNRTYFNFI